MNITPYKRAGLLFVLILPFYIFGQSSKPYWVETLPTSNSERYVGRGEASLKKDNYKQLAERNALRSIAMEINTEISGTSRRFVIEVNDISQTEFTNEFIVSTLANLQGLEKKGEYSDKKKGKYYVLWEYSKLTHNENIQKSTKNAIEIFNEYQLLEPFQFYEQLDKLVKCYEKLYFVYGNDVYIEIDNRDVNLQYEVSARIGEALRRIQLSSGNLFFKGVYNKSLDKPLKVKINVNLPEPIGKTYGPNMPVEYFFKYGSGIFSDDRVYGDEFGSTETRVIKILEKIKKQQVVARIDLKAFKSKYLEFGILDNALDRLSSTTELIYNIDVSMQRNDRIAVYVKSSEGIDYRTVLVINQLFEEAINRISDFELVDRTAADEIFNKKGYSNADVCDNKQCRVEIGKVLNVDKFVLVDLIYITRDNEISCSMRYTDVLKQSSEGYKNYNNKVNRNDILSTLREIIPNWVTDFYAILNPAKVTFTSNVAGARIYVDGQMYGYLPLIEQEFELKNYLFEFKAAGYKEKKRRINLSSNIIINEDIILNPKTRFKTFTRSMMIPGLGQIYSAEENFENRKYIGYGLVAAGIGLAAITASSWSDFFDKKNMYDDAHTLYLKQTNTNDINNYRDIAENKHTEMTDAESTALIISSLLGALWIGNALEAMINFPDYETSHSRFSFNDDSHSDISLGYSYYFK
jgi:hypothetical protein